MIWKPITKKELEKIICDQCLELNSEELIYFREIQVPFRKSRISRSGKIEEVFIVAELADKVVFYEDIEEGFEISTLNEEGIIREYGASQFTIKHIIKQLNRENS